MTEPLSGNAAIQAAISAVKSGKDPMVAAYGESAAKSYTDDVADSSAYEDDTVVDATAPYAAELAEETAKQSSGKETTSEPKLEAKAEDVEEIVLTDDSGKRKIKWNFADREKTKQAVLLAAGARKWQAERDAANSRAGTLEKELTDYKNVWNSVESAYQKGGIEGLINHVAGKENAAEEYRQSLISKHEVRRGASPSEIRALEAEEAAEKASREKATIQATHENFLKDMQSQKEKADEAQLKGVVYPAFYKFSFEGKLGNPQTEEMYNTMVWNAAIDRLDKLSTAGTAVTPAIAEKEFREVSSMLRKHLNVQTEKQVTKVIEGKKADAQTRVATRATASLPKATADDEIRAAVRKGGLSNLLISAFSKK